MMADPVALRLFEEQGKHEGHHMYTLPSPKTIICRDCTHLMTIRTHDEDEIPFHFCERCGGQSYDIADVEGFMRHKPVQFLKNLLHTKIF